MNRNILLVEPDYKTKFPPMGLMKISSYHKILGDKVSFVKGINHDLAYEYWDRIYVSTLFTFYWKITIDTIKYYKTLVGDDPSRIAVGGIMASLMPNDVWDETGILPKIGVLNSPNLFGDNNELVIEDMIPDYELFNESGFKYTLLEDSYFGYSTRGCVNKCKFCGVHRLEPDFIDYQGIKPYIKKIEQRFGEKANLVFFDNNILASKKLDKIVGDLIELGFGKDTKFAYKNKAGQMIYKQRHVDFNQGTDARLINKDNINLLSKLPINPLRIAFDNIRFKKTYVKSILLAKDKGLYHLSNYILYNFKDTPEDFWERLKINIDLNKSYGLKIYSFPMKYIPLDAKDRSYVDEPNWNWLFVRNVQRILNVMKGSVMPGEDFFFRAFGESEKEFKTILYMPERILMHRTSTPQVDEKSWLNKFHKLTGSEMNDLLTILCENRSMKKLLLKMSKINNLKIKNILEYYIDPIDTSDKDLPLFSSI